VYAQKPPPQRPNNTPNTAPHAQGAYSLITEHLEKAREDLVKANSH
jgi:hypothetical protein